MPVWDCEDSGGFVNESADFTDYTEPGSGPIQTVESARFGALDRPLIHQEQP
jgi:hypothetical protein